MAKLLNATIQVSLCLAIVIAIVITIFSSILIIGDTVYLIEFNKCDNRPYWDQCVVSTDRCVLRYSTEFNKTCDGDGQLHTIVIGRFELLRTKNVFTCNQEGFDSKRGCLIDTAPKHPDPCQPQLNLPVGSEVDCYVIKTDANGTQIDRRQQLVIDSSGYGLKFGKYTTEGVVRYINITIFVVLIAIVFCCITGIVIMIIVITFHTIASETVCCCIDFSDDQPSPSSTTEMQKPTNVCTDFAVINQISPQSGAINQPSTFSSPV